MIEFDLLSAKELMARWYPRTTQDSKIIAKYYLYDGIHGGDFRNELTRMSPQIHPPFLPRRTSQFGR
jgi:hypothetical protein